jgi:aldose 1-epimerase
MTTPTAAAVRDVFGTLPDGREVERWTLTDATGASAAFLNYGAIVQSLNVPDARGETANVVLGFSTLDDYLERSPYFGCVAGRYANRIAGGTFELAGKTYQLPLNDGDRPNTLHGGPDGFDRLLWTYEGSVIGEHGGYVEFSLVSEDGDQGFPGRLSVTVRYTLMGGFLLVAYKAETDAPTVVNLTNHSYFNLSGEGTGTIDDHVLTLKATEYLPVDSRLIPTAAAAPVAGTPFDFRAGASLGARLDDPHEQLRLASGYDHCFVLDEPQFDQQGMLRYAAILADPASGRVMELTTNEPGLQVFTADSLSTALVGTSGSSYGPRAGVALETQHFPDSPNRPDFPSTVLLPGEVFRSSTMMRFTNAVDD